MFGNTFNEIKYFGDAFAEQHEKLSRITQRGNYQNDKTMLAFARALLFNRLPEGETFSINIYPIDSPIYQDMMDHPKEKDELHNQLFVFYKEDDTIDEAQVNAFYAKYPTFHIMQQHMDFFSSCAKAWCYNDTENISAILFLQEANVRKMHLLFSMLSAYFKPLCPVMTGYEKTDFCPSMTKRASQPFEECMAHLAHEYGIDQEYMAFMIRNYTRNNVRVVIDQAERTLAERRDTLQRNIEEYTNLYRAFKQASDNVELLKSRPVEEDTELVDFFKAHKNIRLFDVSGDMLKFYVLGTLEWFDLEFYHRAARNDNAIYRINAPRAFSELEDRKLLMDAIFSDDPIFKIRMCSSYGLSITGDVDVWANYNYPADILKQYIPNPHIQYHRCLGDHRDPIRRALRDNNMPLAIEQCIASAQSVNIAERSVTFDPFMKNVFSSTNKILVDMKGKEYTPVEALKYLKKKAQAESK